MTVSRTVKINLGNYENVDLFESATTKFDDDAMFDSKQAALVRQVENRLRKRITELGKDPTDYLPQA